MRRSDIRTNCSRKKKGRGERETENSLTELALVRGIARLSAIGSRRTAAALVLSRRRLTD